MNENLGKRGKYRFGLLAIGETVLGDIADKKSARSYVYQLNRISGKRFRLLSDRQGFIVLRVA